MLKLGLSVQCAADRKGAAQPAVLGMELSRSKTSERSLFAPALFSPCADARHAGMA
jgi:hypothetical protein